MLFPNMRRVKQLNEYYCGPAALEMLFSRYHIGATQDEIVTAAEVQHRIKEHGMVVAEMAKAVARLAPSFRIWMKREAKISELSSLINTYQFPMAVEWQGIFDEFDDDDYEEEGYESGDDDAGHYGVITGVSTAENWITMADPFMNKGVDRQLTVLEFERRWWDINEIINPYSGKRQEMDDYHLMFTLLPADDATLELFGMEAL